ncbi:MAG: NAD(P)-dependent oxidoreductase [Puniceicoccales bacterium]
MTVFIAGATGATGSLLTRLLLDNGFSVRVVVRSRLKLPQELIGNPELSIREASLLELSDDELRSELYGCDAVASCLGHPLSVKGIWGKPRDLVTSATQRLCESLSVTNPERSLRFILMSSSGVHNRSLSEPCSFLRSIADCLLTFAVPPHADNIKAASYLHALSNPDVQWVAVRPDALIDQDEESPYDLYPSPIRDALFDAGKTSRINVAHFMMELLRSDELWRKWFGQMPVIYNAQTST